MAQGSRGEINVSERAFVVEMLRLDDGRPRDAAEAYERAFGAQTSRASAAGKARALLQREYVKKELSRVTRIRDLEATRRAGESRSYIERELRGIVASADRQSDRVSALRELRQLVPDSAHDALDTLQRHELIERVRTLLASQLGLVVERVVDGTSTMEPPEGAACGGVTAPEVSLPEVNPTEVVSPHPVIDVVAEAIPPEF